MPVNNSALVGSIIALKPIVNPVDVANETASTLIRANNNHTNV